MKAQLFFKYKGAIIEIEKINNNDTSDDIFVSECNNVITDYNLMYTYTDIYSAEDNVLKKLPLVISYKNCEYNLYDFKLYMEGCSNLPNIDFINGIEVRNHFQNLLRGISDKISELDIRLFVETSRLFQNLYDTFSQARHALIQARTFLHHSNNMPWSNGAVGQFIYRQFYVNNAIIWYNSAFDILLQCLWIGKTIFTRCENTEYNRKSFSYRDIINNKDEILSKIEQIESKSITYFATADINDQKQFKNILKSCNLREIIAYDTNYKYLQLFRENGNTESGKNIATFANELKHKQGIQYEETFQTSGFFDLGCPDVNLTKFDIDKIISDLMNYHIKFIPLVKQIYNELKENFRLKDIDL